MVSTNAYRLFRMLSATRIAHLLREIQELMQHNQDSQRDHENHPAGGGMKESFGQLRLVLGQNSGESDATGIGQDSDRYRSNEEHPSHPHFLLEEIAVYQGQESEREQRPDTAAGFHHRQPLVGQFQDVTFTQHRNLQYLESAAGKLAGQYLQRERDLVVDNGGDWHHEKQQKPRKRENAQITRSAKE